MSSPHQKSGFPRKGRRVASFVAVLALLGLSVAIWLFRDFRQPSQAAQTFDGAVWRSAAPVYGASNDPGCVRGGMAQDLIQRQLLVGKSVPQVLELMGQPERRDTGVWAYELGQCSGWGWSDSELLLEFDAGGTQVLRAVFQHIDPG
jgi:hypothetical protein